MNNIPMYVLNEMNEKVLELKQKCNTILQYLGEKKTQLKDCEFSAEQSFCDLNYNYRFGNLDNVDFNKLKSESECFKSDIVDLFLSDEPYRYEIIATELKQGLEILEKQLVLYCE